jgi:hypothetical protein
MTYTLWSIGSTLAFAGLAYGLICWTKHRANPRVFLKDMLRIALNETLVVELQRSNIETWRVGGTSFHCIYRRMPRFPRADCPVAETITNANLGAGRAGVVTATFHNRTFSSWEFNETVADAPDAREVEGLVCLLSKIRKAIELRIMSEQTTEAVPSS